MPDATSRRHYIRFQLDELSAANGHHTFEDICREVARARIASNLLPATGPVSSGGDAGRDFETFTSYLPRKLGEHSAFAARVSDKRLAFLCTLQKEGVTTKFERDIETIAASGDTFDKVYAMSAVPISVGSRNRLRKKVRERHGIELEVLDGVWLAEQLADHDLFWVAERYLSVPAHMAPPPPAGPADETPEWYAEELARWHERGELQATVRDILDAKRGLRYATFHDNGRKDLRFWLGLFEPLTAHEHPRVVRQRARYEYAVATLRGAGELRPADAAVRAFFSDALAEEHTARLKDAAVLVAYATGAYGRNLTDLDAVYLRDINDQLRARIQALLDQDPPPTRRALLLDALGFLALLPDPGRLAPPPAPVRVDGADYLDAEGNFTAPEPLTPPEESPLVDLDTGMNAWVELAESLDTARLFPVDELAKLVNLSAPLLVSDRRWRRLVDAVEAAVRRSSGDAAAGENARRRAERLLDAGQLRAALGELHEAKVNWWSGDHLQEALMAMLLISSIYRQLGMMQAAKQYALAATRAAVVSGRDDLRRFVPEGLLSAADCDCLSGAWCNAVDLYELGFTAANAVSDLDEDSLTPRAGNFALILRSASVLACQLEAPIREAMRRCGMAELVDVIGELPQPTAEEVVGSADRDLHGRPFADTSEQRVIRFVALGLDWTVRCENLYEHVLVAERFVAAAQVLLVELADKDLCLLKTTLDIHVAPAAAGRKGEAAPEASNKGRRWKVTLMPEPDPVIAGSPDAPEHQLELLETLSVILRDASLLPRERYMAELTDAFQRGLSHKLEPGHPYDELARSAITREKFEALGRRKTTPPADPSAHPAREHKQLAWQSGPGPTYSRATAEEMLRNRYEMLPRLLRYTLPRLLAEPAFRDLVRRLRSEGWLDWHIAAAVFARTHNLRIRQAGIAGGHLHDRAVRRRVAELAHTPEQSMWPTFPADEYTYDDLVMQRRMNMLHVLANWGLELHQDTPDFPAIEQLLIERYRYADDDIEHSDLFPGLEEPQRPDAA